LVKITGHNITVANSPLAVGPRTRAVRTPVIRPETWIATLVRNVEILALENIMLGP
jgi:hypothetical protein